MMAEDDMLSTPNEDTYVANARAAAAQRFEGLPTFLQRQLSRLAETYHEREALKFPSGGSVEEVQAWRTAESELSGKLRARVQFVLDSFGLDEESGR